VRKGNITRKERIGASGSKAKYNRGTIATDTTASSMAKEIGSSSIAGANRAYSNKKK